MSERVHSCRWYCQSCELPSNTPDGVKLAIITVPAKSRDDAEQRARVAAEKLHRAMRKPGPGRKSSCTDDRNVRVFGITVQ